MDTPISPNATKQAIRIQNGIYDRIEFNMEAWFLIQVEPIIANNKCERHSATMLSGKCVLYNAIDIQSTALNARRLE